MTADTIIDRLHASGLSVEGTKEGTLLVRPKGRITPEIGELVRSNKTLLLGWLAQPWDGQVQADGAIARMNLILESIQVPIDTTPACASAQINLVKDCREMAASRVSARWLAGVLRMPEYAETLKASIERYCREELYHRRMRTTA